MRFDLPVELRNDIARLEIAGEASAAGVQLPTTGRSAAPSGSSPAPRSIRRSRCCRTLYYLGPGALPFTELELPARVDNLTRPCAPGSTRRSVLIMGRRRLPARSCATRWRAGRPGRRSGPLCRTVCRRQRRPLSPHPLRRRPHAWRQPVLDDPQPLSAFSDASPFQAGL
ncbi:MAG: hypothetical protein HPM95_14650 [Alphaproteobacteria bacterium]|nr:hypothetical protein [Alphaproteobacteria bacterium]